MWQLYKNEEIRCDEKKSDPWIKSLISEGEFLKDMGGIFLVLYP